MFVLGRWRIEVAKGLTVLWFWIAWSFLNCNCEKLFLEVGEELYRTLFTGILTLKGLFHLRIKIS